MSRIIAPETSMSFDGLFTVGSIGVIQETKAGDAVLNLSICFNTQGDKGQKIPVWIDCQVWGALSHHCARLVRVGDVIYVKGKMHAPRAFKHHGKDKINLRAELVTFTVVKKRHEVTGSPERPKGRLGATIY